MQKDFQGFQFIIVPIVDNSDATIELRMRVIHIETDIWLEACVLDDYVKKHGGAYVIVLMQDLVRMLKTKLGYTDHLQ